jgi:hypothetical protein
MKKSIIPLFYIVFIIMWLLGWIVIQNNIIEHKDDLRNYMYLGAFLIGLYPLIVNYYMWKDNQPLKGYITEVELIRFVETNANYLIFTLTGFCILTQAIITVKGLHSLTNEYVFFAYAASVCVIGGVFPLIWMPPKGHDSTGLLIYRHFKTALYSYALGFLIAMLVALIKMSFI